MDYHSERMQCANSELTPFLERKFVDLFCLDQSVSANNKRAFESHYPGMKRTIFTCDFTSPELSERFPSLFRIGDYFIRVSLAEEILISSRSKGFLTAFDFFIGDETVIDPELRKALHGPHMYSPDAKEVSFDIYRKMHRSLDGELSKNRELNLSSEERIVILDGMEYLVQRPKISLVERLHSLSESSSEKAIGDFLSYFSKDGYLSRRSGDF